MMAGGSGAPANPYISNGLEGWWDGLWNTGVETHDNSSMTWKDLAGSNDMALNGNATFTTNALVIPEKKPSTWASFNRMQYSDNNVTMEIVFKASSSTVQAIFNFDIYGAGFKGIATRSNNRITFRQGGPDYVNVYTSPLHCAYNYQDDYIYVNGVKVTATGSGGSFTNPRYGVSFDSRDMYSFSGEVYCIRIYGRLLTDAEIYSNYLVDKTRYNL